MSVSKEQTCKLRLTDFNCFGHLRIASVMDIFQDLATEQSIEMGMGISQLREKGLIWVVVRQKFEIFPDVPCQPYQQVQVRTWPHSPSRLSFLRDYSLRAADGNLLAKGTSEWLLLDMESKSFASVLDNYSGSKDFCEERMFEGKLKKIKDFEAPAEPALTIIPSFSDVDFNMHINNARYADYAMNAVPQAANRPLRTFAIDYRKELKEGQPVHLFVATDDAGTHVKGLIDEGDISFNCLLGY